MFSIIHLVLFLTIWNTSKAVNITVTEGQFDASYACPSGWFDMFHAQMGCLQFYHDASFTWEDARKFCHSQGGNLVEITSSSQLEFVRGFLDGLDNIISSRYWCTAGSDLGVEGQWRWMVSFKSVGSFVWASGQPNDGEDAQCLALKYGSYFGYDDPCSSTFLSNGQISFNLTLIHIEILFILN